MQQLQILVDIHSTAQHISVGTSQEMWRLIDAFEHGDVTFDQAYKAIQWMEGNNQGTPEQVLYMDEALKQTGVDTTLILARIEARRLRQKNG